MQNIQVFLFNEVRLNCTICPLLGLINFYIFHMSRWNPNCWHAFYVLYDSNAFSTVQLSTMQPQDSYGFEHDLLEFSRITQKDTNKEDIRGQIV